MNQAVKKHDVKAINMTREEATGFMGAIDAARMDCVRNIRKARRARTWTNALKLATIDNETDNLERLDVLHERIGTAFGLGGY